MDSNSSLESRVYTSLFDDIISGKLAPGEALTELGESARLGVSRTPVRDAFHLLEKDGLVTLTPNKGAVVTGISEKDVVDIYKMRMRLEGLASREAAELMSEGDKAKLLENLALSEFYISRGDTNRVKDLDTEFHALIYGACGSRMLCRILSRLHCDVRSYRKQSLDIPGRLEKSLAEHRAIYDAIVSGDTDRADQVSASHVRAALENLTSHS